MPLREIPDHPGYYADSTGQIWSSIKVGKVRIGESKTGHDMRLIASALTYVGDYARLVVTLGRGRHRKVSRLVCATFHGPAPSPRHHAAHLNGDSLDNRPQNLTWKAPAENEADKVLHGTSNRGERQGLSKLTTDRVREIRQLYRAGGIKQKELAERYGVAQPQISAIVNRKQWAWLDAETSDDAA